MKWFTLPAAIKKNFQTGLFENPYLEVEEIKKMKGKPVIVAINISNPWSFLIQRVMCMILATDLNWKGVVNDERTRK